MERCSQHSGLEKSIQHLAGDLAEVKETTGKIWTELDTVATLARRGDVERRVADAKRSTALAAWRAVALVLGVVSAVLGLGVKLGLF